jgi:hypothetical protein
VVLSIGLICKFLYNPNFRFVDLCYAGLGRYSTRCRAGNPDEI